ncbi:MAG: hypothetical protein ACD_45C00365G0006 [uncultured bacterium]|nr:MAG: hypothetical protein ACD_45C00365G0006 [uncultured bacterium]
MNNIQHILSMGGYGWYVWPAYCVTLFVFGINLVIFAREKKQIKKTIQHYLNTSP